MEENLMNSEHKATNDKYRDNYDRIFFENKRPWNYGLKKCKNCGVWDDYRDPHCCSFGRVVFCYHCNKTLDIR